MKNKQSCAVIRDLLPLYVDQLTSDETNEVIEEHLKECEGCNSLYHSMKEEFPEEQNTKENMEVAKEVDYLKKIRANSRKKVWLGIGGVILSLVVVVFIKIFVYGSPSEGYVADISVEDNQVKITGTFIDSASVYSHYKIVEKNGTKQLVVYATVSSPWNHNDKFEIECNLEEAKEQGLVAGKQKITKSGEVISLKATQIYAKKHPYVGDMSKNSALANSIGIGDELGAFKNELQTKDKPYGWTLYFETTLESSNEVIFNEKMRGYAYVLLATIDNLDEVTWSYVVKTTEGTEQKAVTLTGLEATGILNKEIKSFGESEEGVEELLTKIGIRQDGSGNSQLKTYKYRLTLTGRMPNAEEDSTFIVLTDRLNISFDEVAKSLYSSNSEDALKDAIIVSME